MLINSSTDCIRSGIPEINDSVGNEPATRRASAVLSRDMSEEDFDARSERKTSLARG